jgi:hypothetical protein
MRGRLLKKIKQDFHYKEINIMDPMETMMSLQILRLAMDAMGLLNYCDNKTIVEEQYKAIDEAIAAVEKTIPQKVKRDPFGVECPNCGGRIVLPTTYTFNGNMIGIRCDCCYSCGQALDWGEE